MKDYLIVGSGLAGIAFAELALQNNKTITVFENYSQNSSLVAGGLYNPVILKRFSEVWKAQEQISLAQDFYSVLEGKLNTHLDFKVPIYRKLFSIEEQNNWFVATDKPSLAPFLATELKYNKYNGIDSPFGFGEVLQSGYVDIALLLSKYQSYLTNQGLLWNEAFHYGDLDVQNEYVVYKQERYKQVVFAEGFGMHANPFFSNLPLDGTKGELLVIRAPELKLDVIIKSSVFILPIGNDLYKVGATYNWEDKTPTPTAAGRNELLTNLKALVHCDFEVVDHLAGVRPTVKDRRPMVGTHPKHPNLHVLNGLGTRGVMLAPAMAKALFENIENQIPLEKEIDIKRFKKMSWD
ncbi:FAD-binding oxidoreductase [Flavobacterium sp.]|uniref:NAD(P)/FAD-dependent oxidoreductase n=1 Tax=Flavobacterium sp. TaxID=239 RepID=UPI0025BC38E5|nr:FAD-dependent oxidoreductase [Flavobacterium sp.]MBA4154887.1 FAD-dependent oxidoreductase [Flavobacterium sp.]